MLKSKHSGWLADGTRTPFGNIGKFFASIDPGPAIGNALAEVDKTVNREVPGGWYTVGGLAAGGTALYFAPEIMAAMGAEAGTAITTEAGQAAFFDSLAAGANSTEAISAGLAADVAAGGTGTAVGGFTDANLGYTGAASELGLEGATSGITDLSGNQGSAILESLGLNTSGMSAGDVAKYANRAKNLANLLSGGTAKSLNPKQISNIFDNANSAQTANQFGGLYRMNQNPFVLTSQPKTVQNPLEKTQDFLAQISQESKPEPTLADLLRNS